jgi:hypothetical protein
LTDKQGMKPTAVQYSNPFAVIVSELARISARHGVTAYALSLMVAFAALLASVFHQEIARSFGREVLGVRVVTIWEAAFVVGVLVWAAATVLGTLCVPQKGRTRSFGISTVGINVAAAIFVACTMI